MRTLWALLLGGLALVGTVEARLGETKEQVIKRYGQPIKELVEPPFDRTLICLSGGFQLTFFFFDGFAEVMMVKKDNLNEEEVKTFLSKNSNGEGFKEVADEYGQKVFSEKDRLGIWSKPQNQLTIMTGSGFTRAEKTRQNEIKEKTKDF